jgi:hypothetical protein
MAHGSSLCIHQRSRNLGHDGVLGFVSSWHGCSSLVNAGGMRSRFLAQPLLGGLQLPLVQLFLREEVLDLGEHFILFFFDVMLDVLAQNLELGVESFAAVGETLDFADQGFDLFVLFVGFKRNILELFVFF